MRLLIVTPGMHAPWVDGRITSLKTFAETLAGQGVTVQVLTTANVEKTHSVEEKKVQYKLVPGGSSRNWFKLFQYYADYCAKDNVDIVIYRPFAGFNSVNVGSIILFRLVTLFFRKSFVLSLWSGPKQMVKIAWLFSGVFTTHDIREKSGNVRVIPPIVDGSMDFKPVKDQLFSKFGFEKGKKIGLFTYCGLVESEGLWNYTMEKRGLRTLIDAGSSLLEIPNFQIIVSIPFLSKDSARLKLQKILEERGLEKLFVLTSSVDDHLYELLSLSSVYIYPVNIEEISWAPISMIEAFACGTPVVTTKIPAITNFISDDDALLTSPGDSDSLARSIKTIINDPMLAKKLCLKGKKKAEDFGPEAVGEQVQNILEQV